jgi:Polyketide cyclase / dehydrase and lipid transport
VIAIEHTAHSAAARAAVWARLADLRSWHEWGPWTRTDLDGDIRTMVSERKRLTGKPYVMKERVVALEPDERFEYELISGLPLRRYRAVVTLEDDGGGTAIHWRSTFDPPWPFLGGLWRGGMLKVIRDVSERLAAVTE